MGGGGDAAEAERREHARNPDRDAHVAGGRGVDAQAGLEARREVRPGRARDIGADRVGASGGARAFIEGAAIGRENVRPS